MPSLTQIEELLNNTTSEWTSVNGVDGRKFTGFNGSTIFLPAAGIRWDSVLRDTGSDGHYWSSTLLADTQIHAYDLDFYSGGAVRSNYDICIGRSVRPVR